MKKKRRFPRPLREKDEFSTEGGSRSRSKWSSFDDGYYHDALFPATVSIFHPHVDKKRLWPPVPRAGVGARTHVTADPATDFDRFFNGCWSNTSEISLSLPLPLVISSLYNTLVYTQHCCRKYVINVGNQGPVYCNRPCVMRFSRFRFDVSTCIHVDSPPNRKSPIRPC